jgi:hypothetical protein
VLMTAPAWEHWAAPFPILDRQTGGRIQPRRGAHHG